LTLQHGCSLPKLLCVVVGTGDVRAGRLTTVQARAVDGVRAVAQRSVAVVDTHQQGIRVAVDGQSGVVEDVAGLPRCADRAGEGRCLGCGLDGPARGRPGNPRARGEVLVEGGEGVGGGAGRLEVEEFVDAVATAR
jgi:hypothetical protein